MEWYKPDTRWDLYTTSKEDFVNKFVVEGKFHKNVPEDIVKSFETVAYLLAHSYYHWPMFDEAMSKMLLIMEMVIKLKAKKLGIPLEKTTKNNRIIKRRLLDIINDVFKNEYLKFLKPDFDRARKFRNIKMHPDQHHFMGAMGFTDANARLFVNTINSLFLKKNDLIDLNKSIDELEAKLHPFQKGLHVLGFKDQRILIDGFHIFKYRTFKNNKLLLLYINPLTTKVHEQFVEHKYPDPLIITFTDFQITKNSIEGIDIYNEPMKIYIDDNKLNLKTYFNYNEELSKVPQSDIDIFINFNGNQAIWQMEKTIYENCFS